MNTESSGIYICVLYLWTVVLKFPGVEISQVECLHARQIPSTLFVEANGTQCVPDDTVPGEHEMMP